MPEAKTMHGLNWLSPLPQPKNYIRFERSELEKSVSERFEKQATLYPNRIAVKKGDALFTYNELNRLANQLAHRIVDTTGGVSGPVAFLFDQGINPVVAILGILKSGNGYLALDPAFPKARLEFMVSDSESLILITDNKNLALVSQFADPKVQILNMDEISPDTPSENLERDISPYTLAHLEYTSGSTGQPKGCPKSNLQCMHDIYSQTNRRFINPDDRYILLFTAGFGLSKVPILSTLLNGACLFPYDIKDEGLSGLADFLLREKITIYYSVPSTFRHFTSMLKTENGFPDLRLVMLSGETILKNDVELYKKYFSPTCILDVVLGGTEFQEICSYMISKDTQITGGIVPVGYLDEDKYVLLLNEEGVEVPVGEVGEIVVQSRFISSSYWRRPEQTEAAFKPVPGLEGVNQYRTGDLGRFGPDGCLEHLGRKDRQVKIRGHRVELTEIIYALMNIPAIKDAYVLGRPDSAGENKLVAYLVPAENAAISISHIREELAENLPVYMIPAEFLFMSEFPKTPSGKIDELALPEPERTRESLDSAFVSPQNQVEDQMVSIWETLLDVHPVGIKDDFFALGGHSLLALRFIAEVEDKLGVTIPFPALVQSRTIEKLASLVQDQAALSSWSHLVALQPLGSKPPFYCVPPSAVTVMIFKDLAKYLDVDRPFYGLEYTGMDKETEAFDSIPAIARYNLDRIRSLQPEGPYYLGGMCFGGLIAYEMASQLVSEGEQVAFLGILDSTHAPYLSKPRAYYVFLLTRFINQKILRYRFPVGMAPLRQATKKFEPGDDFSKRVYQVFTTHNYARVKYIATPYPGKITLFNTAGSRGDFSRDQWRAVTKEDLEAVSIPGIHAGAREGLVNPEQSFIFEPNVQVLAQKLNEHLDKAGLNGK
jgi:amino acid adenylation domain-containing protein